MKEINRLLKEINRLLTKGMSNIYLKVPTELLRKSLSPGQFLESFNSRRYH